VATDDPGTVWGWRHVCSFALEPRDENQPRALFHMREVVSFEGQSNHGSDACGTGRTAEVSGDGVSCGAVTLWALPRSQCAGSRLLAGGRVRDVTTRGLVSHIYFTFGHRQD
jgi:hypothetical protein